MIYLFTRSYKRAGNTPKEKIDRCIGRRKGIFDLVRKFYIGN